MAITFHCNYCGKKIEAQASAGGKWGKCPSCHNKVYVPNLEADNEEELKLAPIDETEEEKKKQLMAETFELEQEILSERKIPNEGPVSSQDAVSFGISPDIDDKELTTNIITYLRLMADGELEQAESKENLITPFGNKAMKILDSIALADIPEPELADIPQHVLSGLIRTLRSKIS